MKKTTVGNRVCLLGPDRLTIVRNDQSTSQIERCTILAPERVLINWTNYDNV